MMSFILSLEFLGGITLAIVFLYFFSELIRTTSKFIERRYFVNRMGFPTTYLMMYEDKTFSRIYKDTYRQKAKALFGMDLPSLAEERDNPTEARKRLQEIAKLVILRIGSGRLVMKHNIWYGFFRNLIGGSLYSVVFCILNICIGAVILENTTFWTSSLILLIGYASLLVLRKHILIQHAEAYAKQLFAEFMMFNKREGGTFALRRTAEPGSLEGKE